MPLYVRIILFIVILAAAIALAVWWARRRLAAADIYLKPRTKFGPALIFTVEGDDGERVRVLNVGGMYQSAAFLDDDRCYDLVFAYTLLYDKMFEAGVDVRNVLMIGGGGYSYPKHLISSHPEVRMDVVEVDPAITSLASRYFFLDRLIEEFETEKDDRLGLVCADGRAFLDERAGQARYDAILNDSFSGKEPVASLASVEAARSIHGCLTPGGLYLTNVVSALEGEGSGFIHAVVATLGEVFAHVYVIPCGRDELADRDNNMVIATDSACTFADAYDTSGWKLPAALTDADAQARIRELVR